MNTFKDVNLPNMLTMIRLGSPLVFPLLLVYFLPYNKLWANTMLATFFVVLGLTDFFDGYLARKYDQVTSLGKMLDPIADKCLVYSTLVALLASGKIFFYWVVLFIGREFFVMGLRLVALEHNLSIPVSMLGKVKTFFQMVLLTWIIANPYQKLGLRAYPVWNWGELWLLIITLFLTVISAHHYYKSFITVFMGPQDQEEDEYPVLDADEIDDHYDDDTNDDRDDAE